ncbi:MAG TPA: lysophospholipid acyltransferase family protein [Acidiferrobacteraceae bacterium]|nr:lysophospholipid acyltransferase family protein [Acidiferrobacteraceae bacterium]
MHHESPPVFLINALRLAAGFALLGAIGLAWSVLALPLTILLPADPGRALGRFFSRFGFRVYLKLLSLGGACRLDLRALDALRDQGPMIIAPNHPCLLDAPLILSRIPQLACIMKADIADNVVLGAGARLARYSRNDAPRTMIAAAVAELQAGRPLLLFPEGTRTSRMPLSPIRGSVGLIAKQAQVPVQTVFIEADSNFLGKGWPVLRVPALPVHYRVRLGRRFEPPQHVHTFVTELEEYFSRHLTQPDTLAPWQPLTEA